MSTYNKPPEPLKCLVTITAETPKAILLMQVEKCTKTGKYMGVREAWFPKSQLAFVSLTPVDGSNDVLEVKISEWVAKQKHFNLPAPAETPAARKITYATPSNTNKADDLPF